MYCLISESLSFPKVFKILYNNHFPHELTPFFSPSLLRKEGECVQGFWFLHPLFAKQRGG